MSRSRLAVSLIVGSLATPALAVAAPPAAPAATSAAPEQPAKAAKTDDSVAAQALFDEGLKLIGEGKFAEGCSKLEASNKAAWAPGTTINLADCYEKVGRLASAWAKFLEAEPYFRNRTPPDPRADVAKERADALSPKLSRVTIQVPAGSKVAGMVITRDGDVVQEAAWGTGVPVDPGRRVVEVSAPGKVTWKWEADVGAGGATVTVAVPVLEDAAPVETGMPTQRKIALGVGAAGVAGLVVGGVLGGLTLGKVGDANKSCTEGASGSFVCDEAGAKLRDEAGGLAMGSTISLVAGGVLAAGGVVLWLTAPSGAATSETASGSSGSRGSSGARSPGRALWIAPVVGPTTGLAAGGTF